MTELDMLDKKLLEAMQKGFPLEPEPFFELGKTLGIGQEEALQRVGALKDRGIIREIGAIFDGRALGYQSTLVALRLPTHQLDGAAGVIGQHPGVSHNYARDHDFNLWFTLALPPGTNLEEETQALAARAGAEAVLSLPAIRVFKIGVYFRLSDAVHISAHVNSRKDGGDTPSGIELSLRERAAGRELEADLPLTPQPFAPMAERLAMSQEELLGLARGFLERGIMRRYAALLGHRRLGFLANAMVCWQVPPKKIEEVGHLMASSPAVTHCYERPTSALWPYNLFTMVHAPTRNECYDLARELSQRSGIRDYILLFSIKEYKKQRVRYFE
jgi:DNA-binding Lrp family transcriptional regulator